MLVDLCTLIPLLSSLATHSVRRHDEPIKGPFREEAGSPRILDYFHHRQFERYGRNVGEEANLSGRTGALSDLTSHKYICIQPMNHFPPSIQVKMQLIVAKNQYGLKNKRAALSAMKRKKRYETLLQQVDGTLSTLEMQREALEQAKTNVSVLTAMKSAARALQSAQQHMSVDKVKIRPVI